MDSQKVQLRKIRDFGENFSDTFQFIKQELKPLLISFATIGISFILATTILRTIYMSEISSFARQANGTFSYSNIFAFYNGTFFIILILGTISFSAMMTTVAVYMKYYNEHGASPGVSEVWSEFLKYFLRTLVFGLIQIILFCIGFIFCFLPGLYILFVLMPYAFIIVNEDVGIGEAFNKCFQLIKDNFWISVGLYIVISIIILIISTIVALIFELFGGAGSLFSVERYEGTNSIFNAIAGAIQYFFYIVLYVSVGLHYYNLAEQKYGTGLAEKLENLGQGRNPNDTIEEQY